MGKGNESNDYDVHNDSNIGWDEDIENTPSVENTPAQESNGAPLAGKAEETVKTPEDKVQAVKSFFVKAYGFSDTKKSTEETKKNTEETKKSAEETSTEETEIGEIKDVDTNFREIAALFSNGEEKKLKINKKNSSRVELDDEVSMGTDSRLTRSTGSPQDEPSAVGTTANTEGDNGVVSDHAVEETNVDSQLQQEQLRPSRLKRPEPPRPKPEMPESIRKMSEQKRQDSAGVDSKNTPSLESVEGTAGSISKIKKQLPEKLKNLRDALENLRIEAEIPGSPLKKKDKDLIAHYLHGVTSQESPGGAVFTEENEAAALVFIANQKLKSKKQKVSKAEGDAKKWHSDLKKESVKAYEGEYHVEKVWFAKIRGFISSSRANKEDAKQTQKQRFLSDYEMRKIEEEIGESHKTIENCRDNIKEIENFKIKLEDRKKTLEIQLEAKPATRFKIPWKTSERDVIKRELNTAKSMLKTLDNLRQQQIGTVEYEEGRQKALTRFLEEKEDVLIELTKLSEEELKERQDLKKDIRENRKVQKLLEEKKALEAEQKQVEEELEIAEQTGEGLSISSEFSETVKDTLEKQNTERRESLIKELKKKKEALEGKLDINGGELDAITQKPDDMQEARENSEEEHRNLEKLEAELNEKLEVLESNEESFNKALDEFNEDDIGRADDELVVLPSKQWKAYEKDLEDLGVESMLKGLKGDSARAFHTRFILEKRKTLFRGERESNEQAKFRKAYMLNFESKQIEGAQDKLKEISDRLEKAIEEATEKVPKNQSGIKAIFGAVVAIVGVIRVPKEEKKRRKQNAAVLRNLEKIKAEVERQEKLLEKEQSKRTVLADDVMQGLLEELETSNALTLKTNVGEAMEAIGIDIDAFEGLNGSVEQTEGDHETNISRVNSQGTSHSNGSKFIIRTDNLPPPLSSGYTTAARGEKQVGGGSVRSNTNRRCRHNLV